MFKMLNGKNKHNKCFLILIYYYRPHLYVQNIKLKCSDIKLMNRNSIVSWSHTFYVHKTDLSSSCQGSQS